MEIHYSEAATSADIANFEENRRVARSFDEDTHVFLLRLDAMDEEERKLTDQDPDTIDRLVAHRAAKFDLQTYYRLFSQKAWIAYQAVKQQGLRDMARVRYLEEQKVKIEEKYQRVLAPKDLPCDPAQLRAEKYFVMSEQLQNQQSISIAQKRIILYLQDKAERLERGKDYFEMKNLKAVVDAYFK